MITLCLRKVEIIAIASRGLCNIQRAKSGFSQVLSRSAFIGYLHAFLALSEITDDAHSKIVLYFWPSNTSLEMLSMCWWHFKETFKKLCYSVRTWNFVIWLCLSLLWVRRKIHSSAQLLNLDKSSENAWYFELRHIMNEPGEKYPLIYYHRI